MSKDLYYEDREDDIFLTDGEDNWGYPEIDEYKNGEKKEARNIKVIYDYGTADEETYETVVDRKFLLSPVLKDGYDEVYSDPERKEPYEGGDGVHDCTIYAFKGE